MFVKKPFLSVLAALSLATTLFCSTGRAAISVIDYYRLGDADAGATNGATVNATSQDSAGTKHLTRIGAPTYISDVFSGATLRTGSRLAVSFSGTGQGLSNSVVSTAIDNFGIEAWVRTKTSVGNHSIAYNGSTALSGWGLYQFGGNYGALFGGVTIFGSIPATVNDWAHLALVRAGGMTTLYLNGTPAATDPSSPNVPAGGFGIGLPGQGGGTENFNGDIDEVRLFTFTPGQFSTNDLLVNAPVAAGPVRKSSALQADADANGKINAGDTLRYTITFTNTFGTNLLNVQLADVIAANQTLVGGSIKSAPIARPDAYTAIGNTLLTIPTISGVLTNDSDPDGDPVSVNGFSPTSANGGTVTMAGDGSFTYITAAGFAGTDTFTYTISDGQGGLSTATVTITINTKVWYVNNAGPNGDGRQNSPFNSLANVNAASSTGDFIYVFQGNGNYSAGITLKNGQQLVGSGDSLVVNGTTIYGGTTRPTILASSGTGVNLGTDNIVHGINVGSANGRAISGASVGNLVISNALATATGGASVILTNGTVNVLLEGAFSTNSVDNGINLSSINGSFVVSSFNAGFITGAAGTDFLVSGGNGTISYGGGINNTAGRSVDISGRTGGTVTLSSLITDTGTGIIVQNNTGGTITVNGGNTTLNTGTNTAVTLNNNTGTTINFSGNGGLDVDTTSATAFSITGGGTVNVTGGFNTINSTTGTTFLNSGTGGSAVIAINAALTGTGRLIDIQNRTSGNVTLSGNLNNTGGTGMLIQNNSGGGTIALSGTTKTFSTGANTAVNLVNNSGTTINFTPGSLSITTTTGTGFNATGGGTVSVVGTGNIISSGNGTGLNVANSTIGASGLTFQSISSSGGSATGIILDTTGTTGGLTVTGDGSNTTRGGNASGGTISSKTGADNSTTTGIGIYLNNTTNISLSRIQINDCSNHGIRGRFVGNFTLAYSKVTGANGTSATADTDINNGEDSVRFTNLGGTGLIESCLIGGGFANNLRVINNSGTLNRLVVANCTIGDLDGTGPLRGLATLATGGNDDLNFEAKHGIAQMNVTITNCILNYGVGDVIQASNNDNTNPMGTMDVVIRHNTVVNSNATDQVNGASGITVAGLGPTTYDVSLNKIANSKGIDLNLFKGHEPLAGGIAANFAGTVFNNTIGLTGVTRSGAGAGATALNVDMQGRGTHTVLIKNNVIRRYGEAGIRLNNVDNNSTAATLNATVIGNTTTEPDSDAFSGIFVVAGAAPATDSANVTNLKLGGSVSLNPGNDFTAGDPFNGNDVFLQHGASGAFNLSKGISGAGTADQVVKDNNVPVITTFSDTGITLVLTVPTLPPAIDESGSPPP